MTIIQVKGFLLSRINQILFLEIRKNSGTLLLFITFVVVRLFLLMNIEA